MSKRYLIIMILILIFALSGCSATENKTVETTDKDTDITIEVISSDTEENTDDKNILDNIIFTELDIDFPDVKPLYVDEIESLPDDMKISETEGFVEALTIKDDCAYYIVTYDHSLRDYCKEVSIFRQNLKDGRLEQIADENYDDGIMITELGYDDISLYWEYYVPDDTLVTENYVPKKYYDRLEDNEIISCGEVSEKDTEEWINDIPQENLKENYNFVGQNNDFIVWEQFEKADNYYQSVFIDIYNKKDSSIIRLSEDEYGTVQIPVLAGDFVFFQTYNDIKSYENENDLYDNIYAVDLKTGEAKRVTNNKNGKTDELSGTMFYKVKYQNGYVFMISADVNEDAEFSFNKLHYYRVD